MTRHSPFHSPEAATPVGIGVGAVFHQVFKTGRAGQPPAWKVRFLRRVVAGTIGRRYARFGGFSERSSGRARAARGCSRPLGEGELDLAVADQLSARFEQLSGDGIPVRLDLCRLNFIDRSGIRALLKAVRGGCRNGVDLLSGLNPGWCG